LKVSPKAASKSFRALLWTVFLNRMYMKVDQDWPPLHGQHERFKRAFETFHVFAINYYIAFLNTVGGMLLPGALIPISECERSFNERSGETLLTPTSRAQLLRLLAKEVSLRRVPDKDQETWQAILHLLGLLADAGFSEAFRLRESVARMAPILK
jgi:hypothetical protein